MSYDLNFYKKENNPITKDDIINYLTNQKHMKRQGDSQWVYHNEETGVYCSFDYYYNESEEFDNEEEDFRGFESTDFSFNINFIRPQFFGKECFPIVEKMVKELNLFISNPQGEGVPQKFTDGELNEDWGTINLRFAKSQGHRMQLSYLDLEKSTAAWEFNFNRNNLQKQLGEECFVPGIVYVKKKANNQIVTICVWPEAIPIALPPVDFISINKKFKTLFRTKEETGIIAYDTVMKYMGKYFKDQDGYKLLNPEDNINLYDASEIKNLFNDLPLFADLDEFCEGVGGDGFVNAKAD